MKSPLSIVVCDDNHDIADSLSLLLVASGCSVTTTYCGREAFSAVEKAKPDVALLDIGLPDMDGYQLASCIRSTPWGADMGLVAITGYGSAADREKARNAGFDVHLTKPVDYPVIEGVLDAMT